MPLSIPRTLLLATYAAPSDADTPARTDPSTTRVPRLGNNSGPSSTPC